MRKTSVHAFSFVELLVVISIIALMPALVAPPVVTMMRGTQLTRAGDKVVALLSMARQTALTKNHSVEVRFYQYKDPEMAGENSANPPSECFGAFKPLRWTMLERQSPSPEAEYCRQPSLWT